MSLGAYNTSRKSVLISTFYIYNRNYFVRCSFMSRNNVYILINKPCLFSSYKMGTILNWLILMIIWSCLRHTTLRLNALFCTCLSISSSMHYSFMQHTVSKKHFHLDYTNGYEELRESIVKSNSVSSHKLQKMLEVSVIDAWRN